MPLCSSSCHSHAASHLSCLPFCRIVAVIVAARWNKMGEDAVFFHAGDPSSQCSLISSLIGCWISHPLWPAQGIDRLPVTVKEPSKPMNRTQWTQGGGGYRCRPGTSGNSDGSFCCCHGTWLSGMVWRVESMCFITWDLWHMAHYSFQNYHYLTYYLPWGVHSSHHFVYCLHVTPSKLAIASCVTSRIEDNADAHLCVCVCVCVNE